MFAFWLVRLFGIPGSRKELLPGIEAVVGIEPEAVHEVKVRAKRRNGVWCTANKSGKDTVIKKPFCPEGKGRWSEAHGKHKEEKDKRTQELRLVFSRPAGMGIKGKEKIHGLIGIKEPELLPGFPEFGMEPFSFGRIKRNFGIVEKT